MAAVGRAGYIRMLDLPSRGRQGKVRLRQDNDTVSAVVFDGTFDRKLSDGLVEALKGTIKITPYTENGKMVAFRVES